MRIDSIRYTNADQDEVEVGSDLGDFYLPWPCRSWHRQAVQDWLDAGNHIRPYHPGSDPQGVRRQLSREAYAHAARLLDCVTSRYAVAEQITWGDIEREARRFLLDGSIGALMQAELDADGRSAEELAYAVIHRANRLNGFRGAVIAARARHLKAIGLASEQVLDDYDVEAGWPEIPPE
jgi:hypothetical protein